MQDTLLVSFGALLGANIRFILYKKFQKLNLSSHFSILLINTLSSFFLGFFISFLSRISTLSFSNQLALFISIGFLGSLSTFSTFVYDLFDLVLKFKFLTALRLLFISSTLGIIALGLGHLWANQ